jgi:hypothetical protein
MLPTITAKRTVHKHRYFQNQSNHAIKNGSPSLLRKTLKKDTEAAARFSALSRALAS